VAVLNATYRLQLHPGFGFADAAAVARYLAELGVSHVYASPYLQATKGSTHGYDVIDHRSVNEELGGPGAHLEMSRHFGEAGLGQILDIVPNHMAVDPGNVWWWDVLENGPASRYARYFDVDWDPPESQLRNLVLVPILADHYGRVLEQGLLGVERHGARFVIRYAGQSFPVAPRSLALVLGTAAPRVDSDELAFLADAFEALPHASSVAPHDTTRRHRDKEVLARLLDSLLERDPRAAAAVDEVVAELNRDHERLHSLLERQNYRLARWQLGTHQLDYRRFFDVTGLVGLRVEDDRVFAESHELILGWLRTGMLDGLRIDHIDGLRDPTEYLERLATAARDTWLVVEKILEADEQLADWPVAGTTGYEFARRATGVLVDAAAEGAFTQFYGRFAGITEPFAEVAHTAKREVLEKVLAADLARLTHHLLAVCERDPLHRDYSRQELTHALTEVLVAFPVYRTYTRLRRDGSVQSSVADRAALDRALAHVGNHTDVDAELVAFLGQVLRLERDDPAAVEMCIAFQQLSGPVMAKGVEDTAFYRYNRFVALNEVGGDPGRFGTSVQVFHDENEHVVARWPATMLSTSTHDTKRSEDVRARLAVLSELPDEWFTTVERWAAMNERHRTDGLPDRNMEYLVYQNLVGVHPVSPERACAYAEKAAREAKLHTSWLVPDERYEKALASFVGAILHDGDFTTDLDAFVATILPAGRTNALAQSLLKLTAPGIPDVYQGSELWDLSLVDPDNRRPVDFALRQRLLTELEGLGPADVLARADEGLPKMFMVHRALAVRRAVPHAFCGPDAGYERMQADGPRRDHVVAFLRGGSVAVVVPRLTVRLGGAWHGTTIGLPAGSWTNVLDGSARSGTVDIGGLLADFPVALLVRSSS
jgi:(1->4)-alpha-D-glucan 1-alpha-D-glucosylmutase